MAPNESYQQTLKKARRWLIDNYFPGQGAYTDEVRATKTECGGTFREAQVILFVRYAFKSISRSTRDQKEAGVKQQGRIVE